MEGEGGAEEHGQTGGRGRGGQGKEEEMKGEGGNERRKGGAVQCVCGVSSPLNGS